MVDAAGTQTCKHAHVCHQVYHCAMGSDIEGLTTEFQCVTVSYGIDCSFLVIITLEYVIITKKLHEIPYDMVTHWNEVINTYLHLSALIYRQLTCYF